jgi:beta-glucosidase
MMAPAAVKGLQGDDLASKTSVLACAKHFAGGAAVGVDRGNTVLDDATFRKIHVEGYKAAIQAGVGSVMASFNSVNGKKVHGQKDIINGILKGDLGFQGFVVSDWAAINELGDPYSNDVTNSINAGIDMIMVPDDYAKFYNTLLDVIKAGRVSQARIDDAVRRILTAKFRLGLFEHPMADRELLAQVGSPEHRALARQAVRESLVLLKNENKVLPLTKETKMVVAGTGADDIGRQCGGWTITWQGKPGHITDGTSVLQGLRNASSCMANVMSWKKGAVPKEAQVALVVVSEKPYAEMKGDRPSLDLDPLDVAAVKRMHDAGLRTVVVILSGRPLILQPILPMADAIVAAWLPGSEGEGVADVLYGDVKPQGKLGHSWPASMDQIPLNVDHLGPDTGATPLYAYGHGLTY